MKDEYHFMKIADPARDAIPLHSCDLAYIGDLTDAQLEAEISPYFIERLRKDRGPIKVVLADEEPAKEPNYEPVVVAQPEPVVDAKAERRKKRQERREKRKQRG